jgi:hypothetical protein
MTTLPDFDISCGSEYNEAIARPENLGVSALSSLLTPPGIFARTDLALSVAVVPGQIDTTHFVRPEILRHIERELIETGLGGTVGRIKVIGDGSIIGNIHHKRPFCRDQERCRIVARNER